MHRFVRPRLFSLLLSALMVSLLANFAQASALRDDDPELKKALREAMSATDSFDNRFDAEVWLTDMSARLEKRINDPLYRVEFLKNVHYEATRAGLRPELVLAVIQVESNFKRFAVSSAGAQGLMQIMPFWLDEIGTGGENLFHVKTNLRFGCTILAHYLKIEKNNLTRALGRYNGSLGKYKYPDKVYKALRKHWYYQ